MKERLTKIGADLKRFWSSRTKQQKTSYIGFAVVIVAMAAVLTFFLSKTDFVPLYKDVSRAEIGRIKEELDVQGIPNQIAPGGTSILVPKNRVDELLVTLAAEGYPNSGTIDYSFFSQNAGFGTTDNEFNMIKLATMQTELANLIKGIRGVKDAQVMITLPTPSVFMNESVQNATAAIRLDTEPGHQFTEPQINALYNLVSKSLPNLSTDDIVIMNQYSEYFDLNSTQSSGTSIVNQMELKKDIERDLQRKVQMMLGTLVGQDKVIVSVTTDIDFKQENRQENLVDRIDEDLDSLSISVQRITETFSGNGANAGGPLEGEDPTDNRTTTGEAGTSNGDYDRLEETINNEVNRIRRDIVESPYKIRDIGIQVMVEPPDVNDVESLSADVQTDIRSILETIISTSIDKSYLPSEIPDSFWENKIAISTQIFNGKAGSATPIEQTTIPWWVYGIGAFLLIVIVILVFVYFRKRGRSTENEEAIIQEMGTATDNRTAPETEASLRKKSLEKMAKDKPEEFAKLLRSWLTDD
ncbi:flagellar basal-body MS-ring/collar protein FliF [Sporosarcina thermotolerans]|uniref:Flagellar M-ring protein n=1 Tax=Sporosarcina thermotolerans TaxID=633404 RepID=A0AAW9A419_9BACL|nr:flagellar basal-body MS-ring/collar protein FliF [Sporosarcina thermotolerans]MDW0115737.1 flagellar basal-body MS-ring/collar protein FliF [Sporosarcina thermotolerans]WHT47009.1 flagellar basal-body MS-ring/collar protein FliF [Sporosarcina thermotolerans]